MKSMTQPADSSRISSCRAIDFEIISSAKSKLKRVPLTSGLCLPKGQLFEPGEWVTESGGTHTAVQTEVLNRWSDGSIRWLLARFVAGRIIPGRTSCALIRPTKRPAPLTGSATLKVDDSLLTLTIRDQHQLARTLQLRPQLAASGKQTFRMLTIEQESTGEVCTTFVIHFELAQHSFIKLQLRLEVWPTCGHIKTEARLRNTRRATHNGGLWDLGDPGSFHFDEFCLHVTDEEDTLLDEITVSPDTNSLPVHLKIDAENVPRQTNSLRIHQYGSGSELWAHPNHINAEGRVPIEQRGFTLLYDVLTETKQETGQRAEPVIGLQNQSEFLTVAIPEFWQQFPSAIEAKNNQTVIAFFPKSTTYFELQGGEQKTSSVWLSVRKNDNLHQLDWVHTPARILQSAKSIHNSEVISWFPETVSKTCQLASRYNDYISDATTGNHTFDARRARIDEYGWRNFGEIHADHEQTHFAGEETIVSHYNNQFDLIFGAIQNLFVSGNPDWFDFFDPYARHMMDIDIYHTHDDRSSFNGGLFWHTDHYVDAATATHRTYSEKNAANRNDYGGGPSCEHNYTTGLLYYYFLTGNPEARSTVLSLADWVIHMDNGATTVFSLLDDGPSGLASSTVFEDYHGPGRGVGNSINALIDAWILTQDNKYQQKCDELILRCVHPELDCDALHLNDAEGHWSYTVCMTALGRYLHHKRELNQLDKMYDYVRRTLSHIGIWMTSNEKPSLSEPDRLQYPTEAWAAQDFRKANVLRIAASCCDDPSAKLQMRQKADELNDAAWQDLYSFGQQHLTARCLSILMTEGLRDVFHREHKAQHLPEAIETCKLAPWMMFVPQKMRVKQMLKNPVRLFAVGYRLLNIRRWQQFWQAVRRR